LSGFVHGGRHETDAARSSWMSTDSAFLNQRARTSTATGYHKPSMPTAERVEARIFRLSERGKLAILPQERRRSCMFSATFARGRW
jgi:hypothetical protein